MHVMSARNLPNLRRFYYYWLLVTGCWLLINIQGGPKTAQSLWHHNFATVHHRDMRFSAKCFERNSLHDLSQCFNTAVKYSLFLQLASELLKNSKLPSMYFGPKTCHYYFFNSSVKHWPIW